MPYKDPAKQREAVRQATARWYDRVKDDPDFIERRSERAQLVSDKQLTDRRRRQRLQLEETIIQAAKQLGHETNED